MNREIIALVDCNNFYVSCELIFRPELRGKPVVVLSNNDGCVISRSSEAKSIGIKMGAPIHECRDIVNQYDVKVFSSNFQLYGDISKRVSAILSYFTPEQEIYSIDESFLRFSTLKHKNWESLGFEIVETIRKNLGINVSIGISQTKTLAKIANKKAKEFYEEYNGVYTMMEDCKIEETLKQVKISDVWGIGRNLSLLLNSSGVYTAEDYRNHDLLWIKRNMGIIGIQLKDELNGRSDLKLNLIPKKKKGILTSRSFRNPVTDLSELYEAISSYVHTASRKLRKEDLLCSNISVFILSSKSGPKYFNKFSIELDEPTDNTSILIKRSKTCLRQIYKKGYSFKKVGVFLNGLVNKEILSLGLNEGMRSSRPLFWGEFDRINSKFSGRAIFYASEGTLQRWKMRQENISQNYTTKWDEIMRVY